MPSANQYTSILKLWWTNELVNSSKKRATDTRSDFSTFSWVIYYICKLLIKKGARTLDKPESYFGYEVEKSQKFDNTYSIDLAGKTVLEIGSNVGGYLYHALKNEAEFVYGVEIDEEKVENSKKLLASIMCKFRASAVKTL